MIFNSSKLEEWLFPRSIEEAILKQKQLADKVLLEDAFDPVQFITGLDVSNNLKDPKQMIYAAAVLLDKVTLKIQEEYTTACQQLFPYIPGLLGFREAPILLKALEGLTKQPQLVMVDGQGISHPRGLGIASHIGVLLDIPTIGVAKSILVGQLAGPLGPNVGDHTSLIWKGKEIGAVLRTKVRCNPLIISVGHRITLKSALDLVLEALKGYRLPEPTRQAHLKANERRRQG